MRTSKTAANLIKLSRQFNSCKLRPNLIRNPAEKFDF